MKDYTSLQNGSDIRGVAIAVEGGKPVNLTKTAVADLALGFAEWLCERTGKEPSDLRIAIGRDSRISGKEIAMTCQNVLVDLGSDVLYCGLATTPAMFMATVFPGVKADGAIMITASHLPYERNGMKFFTKEGGLDKIDITNIIDRAETQDFNLKALPDGEAIPYGLMEMYAEHLKDIICKGIGLKREYKPLKGLKIVVDAGNGAGGFFATKVLEPLGADCSGSQFLEPDGMFPNHQPNPENEEAMQSICRAVKENGADLGIIFDTDVDRSAAVDENGNEIARNRIVALAAVIASENHPGTTIVTDSITSTQLGKFLTDNLGLKHLRFKRGYKNVINKGFELNDEGIDCQLAIETSGHAAMKENYFLDDGAYLATKIVIKAALLKEEGKGISKLLADLKDPLEAKEFRFKVNADSFADYAQKVLDFIKKTVEAGKIEGWSLELPNYEGVRVNVPGGWFLIRKSLHDPVMPLNIESDNEGGVDETFNKIQELLSDYKELQI